MGLLCDYFAAPSDEVAAAVIDAVDGPAAADPALEALELKGVDPVVQMGTLEALLTGVPYDEVSGAPRQGDAVAVRDGGEVVVVTLTDSLQAALAAADASRVAQVARDWSRTEEFWGAVDVDWLTERLGALSALARNASRRGDRLYCWMSV